MLTLAHEFDERLTSGAGFYRARLYGQPLQDGMWGGWLVFLPVHGGRVVATERETTQSSLADLAYWASGLTGVYLEGALERALELRPEVQLARELEALDRMETSAVLRAESLEAEASLARTESHLVRKERERAAEKLLEKAADAAATDAALHERAAAESRATAHAADRALRDRKRARSSKKK